MANKNTLSGGTDFVNLIPPNAVDLNDTFNAAGYVPTGSITSWLKTFNSKSTGTADTNTVDKLVNTSATFITDGVTAGMIIRNTTDGTYAIVGAVDSETSISLAADTQAGGSTTDVFPDGNEAYIIYATPKLQAGWVECNGATLSDAESVYDGQVIPNLNGSAGTKRFLRGSTTSGTTGGTETHTHSVNRGAMGNPYNTGAVNSPAAPGTVTSGASDTLPSFYEVVWIMRIR